MQYVDEYRDAALARSLSREIASTVSKAWTIMEVCGGQTHAIVKFGLDELLPSNVTLVHGPGCPVCVTPLELIDKAITIARMPKVIFCSFGDMLRVPGSTQDLLACKAQGADVRVVYSPLDLLTIAKAHPDKEVVFFAVGFETTAPTTAMLAYQAKLQQIENISLLVSHVLVPPAIEAIMSSSQCKVQGFLAAGHVCTVMGFEEYEPLSKKYRVPIVVTGFEPLDILEGVLLCLRQLEAGEYRTENQYTRSVKREGNSHAREIIGEVFEVRSRSWRGIGEIPQSGLALRESYSAFDAERRFVLESSEVEEPRECLSGLVLQGIIKPPECPAFGCLCTPERPLGAPMVSSEGACASYFNYRLNARMLPEAV